MRRTALALALVLVPTASFPHARQELAVTLEQPVSGAVVDHRQTVSGMVSDPRARVWVVIHPRETGGYWVQLPATVDSDGSWNVLAYFGRVGAADKGKSYEIRAFANPTVPIKPGERMDWPAAAAQSRVVRVTRG